MTTQLKDLIAKAAGLALANQPTAAAVDGKPVIVGLNAYIRR